MKADAQGAGVVEGGFQRCLGEVAGQIRGSADITVGTVRGGWRRSTVHGYAGPLGRCRSHAQVGEACGGDCWPSGSLDGLRRGISGQ